jgi:hypothetical protein
MGANNQKPLQDIQYFPTVASTAYAVGDHVYDNGSNAVLPASSQADQTSETLNQLLFARRFVGICMGQKLASDATTASLPILVDGEYEFSLDAAASPAFGSYLGADEQANGTSLENQQVKAVTNADAAIARVTRAGSSVTKAWGRILSRYRLRPALQPYIPSGALQSLSGAGAVNVTSYLTNATSTGAAQALTLADGLVLGQLKRITHVVDGGSLVLTPSNFDNGTTITFTSVGETALLIWNGAKWACVELANTATPGTLPAIA